MLVYAIPCFRVKPFSFRMCNIQQRKAVALVYFSNGIFIVLSSWLCLKASLCEVYCVIAFVPSVEWPIMPDCVLSLNHSLRVVSEWPNYGFAFNVTTGLPGPLQKVFLVFAKPQVTCSHCVISQRTVWKSLLIASVTLMASRMPWAVWALMRSFQVGVKVGPVPSVCPIWPLGTQPQLCISNSDCM